MQSTQVILPTANGPTPATLYFEHDYSRGGHWIDYLHLIRQQSVFLHLPDPDKLEEEYWSHLDTFRQQFANDCLQEIGNVDIIIDPPSIRGYHRPYLSAFKKLNNIYWLILAKTTPADSGDIEALRKSVKVMGDSHCHKRVRSSDMHNIVIVDDVFATGNTAAVIIELLRQKKLPGDVRFHITAPLLISKIAMNNGKLEEILESDLPPME